MKGNKAKYYLFNLLFLLSTILTNAQNSNNPFDIKSIHEINIENTPPSDTSTIVNINKNISRNPFDIIASPKSESSPIVNKVNEIVAPKVTKTSMSLQEKGQSLLFGIVLIVLVTLTSLVVISRGLIYKVYLSFFNDLQLKTMYRERGPLTSGLYIGLYVMFLINASVFCFLVLYNFDSIFNSNELFTLFYCLAGMITIFLGKHLILYILSLVFPFSKEIDLYSFVLMIFSILIGLILAPTNVFLAYSDISTAKTIIVVVGILIGFIYLVIGLRSLVLNQNLVFSNIFHFLLYLCAIEITPLLILFKVLKQNIQLDIL